MITEMLLYLSIAAFWPLSGIIRRHRAGNGLEQGPHEQTQRNLAGSQATSNKQGPHNRRSGDRKSGSGWVRARVAGSRAACIVSCNCLSGFIRLVYLAESTLKLKCARSSNSPTPTPTPTEQTTNRFSVHCSVRRKQKQQTAQKNRNAASMAVVCGTVGCG